MDGWQAMLSVGRSLSLTFACGQMGKDPSWPTKTKGFWCTSETNQWLANVQCLLLDTNLCKFQQGSPSIFIHDWNLLEPGDWHPPGPPFRIVCSTGPSSCNNLQLQVRPRPRWFNMCIFIRIKVYYTISAYIIYLYTVHTCNQIIYILGELGSCLLLFFLFVSRSGRWPHGCHLSHHSHHGIHSHHGHVARHHPGHHAPRHHSRHPWRHAHHGHTVPTTTTAATTAWTTAAAIAAATGATATVAAATTTAAATASAAAAAATAAASRTVSAATTTATTAAAVATAAATATAATTSTTTTASAASAAATTTTPTGAATSTATAIAAGTAPATSTTATTPTAVAATRHGRHGRWSWHHHCWFSFYTCWICALWTNKTLFSWESKGQQLVNDC